MGVERLELAAGELMHRDDEEADPTLRAFRDAMRDILATEGRFELLVGEETELPQGWNGAIHPSPLAST